MSGVWPILRKVSLHILPNLFAAQKSHQTRVVFVSHIGDSPTRLRQRQRTPRDAGDVTIFNHPERGLRDA